METQRASASPQAGKRSQTLVLGDYSGRGAATVADELRRLGLRPGVQRVDAVNSAELGTILAQDPPAGTDTPRNTIITLYVGAVARTPASVPQPAGVSPSTPGQRRRRKPNRSHTQRVDQEPRFVVDGVDSDWERDTGLDEGDSAPWEAPPEIASTQQRIDQDEMARAAAERATSETTRPNVAPLEAGLLLTPLHGVPRPLTANWWRRLSGRTRIAIACSLVCALGVAAIALAGHGTPSRPRAAATPPTSVGHAVARRPPAGPSVSRARHSRGHTRRARGTRTSRARPRLARSRAPTRPPKGPALAAQAPTRAADSAGVQPPSAAPMTSSAQVPTTRVAPSATSSSPVAIDGQIPGGPFSP